MTTLGQDLRYALRTLRRTPGFTAVAVLTLGLGIGATTTIFSVVHAVLMKPLPYRDPERIASIWVDLGVGNQSLPAVSPLDFLDYRQRATQFEGFAAATGPQGSSGALRTPTMAETERVDVTPVTANLFPLFGVDPMLGRHFLPEEETPGGPQVAILSHRLWKRRFADREIVGRQIQLDGVDVTVVGVMPEQFRLLLPAEAFLVTDAEIWRPLRFNYQRAPARNFTSFTVFGRLKPDVTLAQAQAEMDGIARQLRQEHPIHESSDMRIRVDPVARRHRQARGADAVRAARLGGLRAADRVRERGAPAARAGVLTPARDGAAVRPGRARRPASSASWPPRARSSRSAAPSWAWPSRGSGWDCCGPSTPAICRAWTTSASTATC